MTTLDDVTSRALGFRILSICDDEGLRRSRELLLAAEGYETESVTSNAALIVLFLRVFDVAAICQSVEPERAVVLNERLRRSNPRIRIVYIAAPDRVRWFDADVEIEQGPQALLDGLRTLCTAIRGPLSAALPAAPSSPAVGEKEQRAFAAGGAMRLSRLQRNVV